MATQTFDLSSTNEVKFNGNDVQTLYLNSTKIWEKPSQDINNLEFSAEEPFTLKTQNNSKNWNGTLQYSTDRVNWSTWNGTGTISSGSNNKLYLRGTGNTYLTGNGTYTDRYFKFSTDWGTITCTGNIETLLNYQTVANGNHPTMGERCFYGLFYNGELKTPPSLPATSLTPLCYAYMFNNCQGLESAPTLPATSLTAQCYEYMFQNCKALTNAPTLPATSLANYCYRGMFMGCTDITKAPSLRDNTTLAIGCYYRMFSGCTSLTGFVSTIVPALPATTLPNYCYQEMFYDCSSLSSATSVLSLSSSVTIGQYSCASMFSGCTTITTTPLLNVTSLANYCYQSMFNGCTNLANFNGSLPATTLAIGCYKSMFSQCTKLAKLPNLAVTSLPNYCYQSMFSGCTSIKMSTSRNTFLGYKNEYRIPKTGTGTSGTDSLAAMFGNTGGTFTGTPSINTTYYTNATLVG